MNIVEANELLNLRQKICLFLHIYHDNKTLNLIDLSDY
jgi:hypothetical protein